MIGFHPFQIDEVHAFKIEDRDGHALFVRTTMNPVLQKWALKLMAKQNVRSAAVVGMDPRTGDVLTMASYRADGQPVNATLLSSFPAASLFKIITAAGVVENGKVNSKTTLGYDGRKYDLDKRNIKAGIKEGRNKVTLEKGFAYSINPVFGKLGAFTLGPEEMAAFARRFQFNQAIDFEMPVQKSEFTVPDEEDPYRLAELASGLNRTTKVSPLHGAMLASAMVNNGVLMEPTVVREVFDQENRIYYRHEPVSLGQVVSKRTVDELRKLMRATVTQGTGRRKFKDARRHPVLSKLEIGGKSGTISNDNGHKVDWFVCYARERNGKRSIALASVVIHNEKLGIRAQEIVRESIIQYFRQKS